MASGNATYQWQELKLTGTDQDEEQWAPPELPEPTSTQQRVRYAEGTESLSSLSELLELFI
ncbi:hypothetical protein N7449_007807 [Penicillium cf. viridicatum]|uniref:Uncharacterized protein n=1 Tax=Penicillium cf. viridicatum TaxID=2972119 RepID=A0A9W9JI58_9EURO|nr:hypothetical protein N7449_007807 [Penicillium cf. viridicatum]